MTQQKKASSADWAGKAQFYLQGMSMENSLLQSYRMIFGAIEAILFLVWFQPPLRSPLVIVFGIIFCIAWVLVCLRRGEEVAAWRNKVIEVTRRTEAGRFIQERFEPKSKFKGLWQRVAEARVWLSLVLPLGLIVLWLHLAISCHWGWLGMLLFEVVVILVLWKVYKINLLRL